MTDDVLDRVRATNPLPEGSAAPPFEGVLARARAAAAPAPRLRSVRRFGRLFVPTVTIAVSVLVLVIALGSLHATHRSAVRPAQAGAAAQRQELIARLAVLRRAQTTSDLRATLPIPFHVPPFLPAPAVARMKKQDKLEEQQDGDLAIDRPLLRMETTPAGDEISVAPETWRPSRRSSQRAEGITIAIHTPGNQQTVGGGRPVSVQSFLTHGLAVFNDTRRGAVLVPDGVARVTLVGFGPTAGQGSLTLDSSTIAGQSSAVHDNLATFSMAGLTGTSPTMRGTAGVGASAPVRMVWFNASGQAIAHTSTSFGELYVTVHGTATGSSPGTQRERLGALNRVTDTTAFANTTGTTSVTPEQGGDKLTVSVNHLPPTTPTTAYGLWLVTSKRGPVFLGYVAQKPDHGRIVAVTSISRSDAQGLPTIELTLQHGTRPTFNPGQVLLRGIVL